MPPHWAEAARQMKAAGMSQAGIAKAVGRSEQRVSDVLRGVKQKGGQSRSKDYQESKEVARRRVLRRWCRRNAEYFGKTVDEMYAEYGVANFDKSKEWDK